MDSFRREHVHFHCDQHAKSRAAPTPAVHGAAASRFASVIGQERENSSAPTSFLNIGLGVVCQEVKVRQL